MTEPLVVCCCRLNKTRVFDDHLLHVQVVINCRYFAAAMCTSEEILARYLGACRLR